VKLLAAVFVLMAVQLAACASHRDMSRETSIGITELLKHDLKHP
jgi:hypothetical protein